MSGRRILALWCPDWPAVAAAADRGLSPALPVAVTSANRVLACTAVARAAGVRRGLRRREAQSRCPELTVLAADEDRDARLFEPVVSVVEEVVPGVEILRPGLLVLSANRASRYFGDEHSVAEPLLDAVAAVGVECQVGIADELSTAVVAAKLARIVEPGEGATFLAPLPLSVLVDEPSLAGPGRVDLVDLLRRMGIRTLGAFAGLSRADVASRFGAHAVLAHRLAASEGQRAPAPRGIQVELAVEKACDPPIDRVDMAAFAGRELAERLHGGLAAAGVACTRLLIHAVTEAGEEHSRTWRCAEPLTPAGTADRVRWQMDGWLSGNNAGKPTTGITVLRLEPVEVASANALQRGLFGGEGEGRDRARRAVSRVQGLLGGDSVQIGVRSGGRGPAEQVTIRAWGDQLLPSADPLAPWPGRLPAPAPSVLIPELERESVDLLDGVGHPVLVTARGMFTAEPRALRWGKSVWRVDQWAGPWPVDEGWWDPVAGLRAARAQVLPVSGREGARAEEEPAAPALLLICRGGAWRVEGVYG